MHNPDFWEVCMPPQDLSLYANEAGLWFESRHDRRSRSQREARVRGLIGPIMELVSNVLTEKQRQALILYYFHHKTQEEVAQIMGISRRVVSQHLLTRVNYAGGPTTIVSPVA